VDADDSRLTVDWAFGVVGSAGRGEKVVTMVLDADNAADDAVVLAWIGAIGGIEVLLEEEGPVLMFRAAALLVAT
jgi:hypothetical protein